MSKIYLTNVEKSYTIKKNMLLKKDSLMSDIQSVLKQFGFESEVTYEPYGHGHINDTYLINDDYILQRINTSVFKDPDGLMKNIELVTDFLRKSAKNPKREVLKINKTVNGNNYFRDEQGTVWRVYDRIQNARGVESAQSGKEMSACGFAFGDFQRKLNDFDATLLSETIPDFHNTTKRFLAFKDVLEKDVCGRAKDAQEEISFVLGHEKFIYDSMEMYSHLPLRVTHNDTKLNNVLLDVVTREPVCVIDLDTIMPGYVSNDFGDAVRFGASTAAEDEKDLSKVGFSMEMYNAFKEGFLKGCGNALTDGEVKALPVGAMLMTLECGMRFLTDYLDGDNYFKTAYSEHNLVRCRTQFKLVSEMEKLFS